MGEWSRGDYQRIRSECVDASNAVARYKRRNDDTWHFLSQVLDDPDLSTDTITIVNRALSILAGGTEEDAR